MITALLVSVNYSDYLEVALPYNTKQFDEIIVLTIKSDKACQDLCSKYSNVKCLVFPDGILKKNGKTFNKGALLNRGLAYLNRIRYQDWLVMTDSDIVFPENFNELMTSKEKDSNILYGMNRKHCYDANKFNTYMNTKQDTLLTTSPPLQEMPFVGFCQIFMYKANKFSFVEDYNAENSDLIFLTHFSKHFKKFMDNGIETHSFPKAGITKALNKSSAFIKLSERDFVIHLGESMKNWKGRTTNLFI